MKKIIYLLSALVINFSLKAQVKEPDFVGETYLLKSDGTIELLDKEIADFKESISFKVNGTAQSIFIDGKSAQTKIQSTEPIKLIIRAVDNNSDPISIIKIYKFNVKGKKRTSILSVDRSQTLLASRTYSKNQIKFKGEKYGTSSYLISLTDMESGEYGIVLLNPNSIDQKRIITSCFSVVNIDNCD